MKALMMILAAASMAHATDYIDITGDAAAELYRKLNIQEVEVRDEHGGPAFGAAKYGDKIGCQRDLEGTHYECWFAN